MATVSYKRKRRRSRRLSLRRTMLVWIGGAIVGWAVMVTTVYNLLRFPEDGLTTAQIDMSVDPAMMASEAKKLNQIEPAAGGNIDRDAAATEPVNEAVAAAPAEDKDDVDKAKKDEEKKDKDKSDKPAPPDSQP